MSSFSAEYIIYCSSFVCLFCYGLMMHSGALAEWHWVME